MGWGGYARRGKYRKTQQNDILGRHFPAVWYKINIPDKKFVSIMVVFAGGVFCLFLASIGHIMQSYSTLVYLFEVEHEPQLSPI